MRKIEPDGWLPGNRKSFDVDADHIYHLAARFVASFAVRSGVTRGIRNWRDLENYPDATDQSRAARAPRIRPIWSLFGAENIDRALLQITAPIRVCVDQ